ncbi:hypothetical protein NDU88_006045 [Pleurodeles waltl]|uniref:Uncharacterized protein n=1 Tax=Pleurodeles waltl TaxID=8319 RepID=A0AAV7ML71_PLEWA|nr:hypothetical protein NDU88_006045 [Pleurodeles waltl]
MEERALISLEDLHREYTMEASVGFQYLQLGHALMKHVQVGDQLPESSPLEDRLLLEPMPEKAISLTYKKLMNISLTLCVLCGRLGRVS